MTFTTVQAPGPTADTLRAVLDTVFAGKDYRWQERPSPVSIFARWMGALQEWLFELRQAHPLAFRGLLFLLLILVLAIFAHAVWIFARTVRAADSGREGLPTAGGRRRDREWYRREADRLAAQGRYAEAVQADFLALVLALDGLRLLKFHPSKTPAEYGMEARLAEQSREEFRDLIRRLYGYAFARRPCGPAEFEDWRARAAPERYAPAG
ncbi:MAG TPA: hypothetical protein VFU23_06470 [Gemmatimonadales bacterium]|nr:hypothetical protein [Gemmatimonadales bacterium]